MSRRSRGIELVDVASFLLAILLIGFGSPSSWGAEPFIPRKQTKPPGPPLTPQQAIEKMVVPEGFRVELAASEPAIMNPVAMAFDDRGRLYVTESFEYPRREPGPGRDRIKILEDTDHDGVFDSVKVFAEGLNIPSGIAVGHGGVWVGNAPDILLLRDTNGDDVADQQQVIVTGFGRADTHELPNAFTWGPDGYLYGLNGVFNPSVVEQGGRRYEFTCAMFRIDPVTHRFELFCEGTSNPWGIAFDQEGEAFVSACVIDHLWHLSESGYYHRQGGPYPPHTWKIDSIVDYKHQMAAYCGIEFFDSPAYPQEYRDKLYMGNIHGGCINVDSVARHGSTYRGTSHPDFLTANDVWFMPVAQKVGPDGCLYVLDWYDRYHCYQDANADPEGIDRGHGRLYRIVHETRPAVTYKDLTTLDDAKLIELLDDANIFYRQRASVLLFERLARDDDDAKAIHRRLLDRLRSTASKLSIQSLGLTLSAKPTTLIDIAAIYAAAGGDVRQAAWAIRAAGESLKRSAIQAASSSPAPGTLPEPMRQLGERLLREAAGHDDPRVRSQSAIAAGKQPTGSPLAAVAPELLIKVLEGASDDGLLPRLVWQNLHPRVVEQQELLVRGIANGHASNPLLTDMAPRIATRLLAEVGPDLSGDDDPQTLKSVLGIASGLDAKDPQESDNVLATLLAKLRTGEIRIDAARPLLADWSKSARGDGATRLQLRAIAGDRDATDRLVAMMLDQDAAPQQRREVLETVSLVSPQSLGEALRVDAERGQKRGKEAALFREALFEAIVNRGDATAQGQLVQRLASLPVGLQARIAASMTQRDATAALLLQQIASGQLPKDVLGPNQIRLLAASQSDAIRAKVKAIFGTVRLEESANRQKVVAEMTGHLLKEAHGDASKGWAVYDRICGQCHQLHGRGYEVGPEITRNGRGNFEQLIVSVFDPSLVIGEAYQSVTVLTEDGRAISGLVTERSAQRIVLKVQGGKTEVIPTDEVQELRQNAQSLMPEGLEEQMTRQEMADLFALLSLQSPPDAKENTTISGTPESLHTSP